MVLEHYYPDQLQMGEMDEADDELLDILQLLEQD